MKGARGVRPKHSISFGPMNRLGLHVYEIEATPLVANQRARADTLSFLPFVLRSFVLSFVALSFCVTFPMISWPPFVRPDRIVDTQQRRHVFCCQRSARPPSCCHSGAAPFQGRLAFLACNAKPPIPCPQLQVYLCFKMYASRCDNAREGHCFTSFVVFSGSTLRMFLVCCWYWWNLQTRSRRGAR